MCETRCAAEGVEGSQFAFARLCEQKSVYVLLGGGVDCVWRFAKGCESLAPLSGSFLRAECVSVMG